MKFRIVHVVILVSLTVMTLGIVTWPKPHASKDITVFEHDKSEVLAFIHSDPRYSRLEIHYLGDAAPGVLWYRISTSSNSKVNAERELLSMTESLVQWGRELPYLKNKHHPNIGLLDFVGVIGYSPEHKYNPRWIERLQKFLKTIRP